MIFDNHSHTVFSSDSEMEAEAALEAAARQGLGLVFTEHYDYDYINTRHYKEMEFRFDAAGYWEKYLPYRGDSLRLGVEIGLSETSGAANREFLQGAPFDLVIGSIHIIDMLDLYYPDFYEGKSKAEAFGRYLRVMADMLRANPYIDVLGHIDYICRYAAYEDKELAYGDFAGLVDEVLQAAIDCDVVMELNTRRLGDSRAVEALLPVYRRYRELGGRYITLGSDAHAAENIGMNFRAALDMTEALELQPVTFEVRKMAYCR